MFIVSYYIKRMELFLPSGTKLNPKVSGTSRNLFQPLFDQIKIITSLKIFIIILRIFTMFVSFFYPI